MGTPAHLLPNGAHAAAERQQPLLARLADVKVRLLTACGPKRDEYWRLLNLFLHGQVSKHELERQARARRDAQRALAAAPAQAPLPRVSPSPAACFPAAHDASPPAAPPHARRCR
jgi:hypothetical protein